MASKTFDKCLINNMKTMESTELSGTAGLAGKYLTFTLGAESYGIPVLKIREIIRLPAITAVPQMPECIKGVINLRGKIIPVVDLCKRFALAQSVSQENACIVVVQVMGQEHRAIQVGLIVSAVEEVCQLADSDIEATPEFGTAVDTSCLLGMAKGKGKVKTLLDIDRVLSRVVPSMKATAELAL